MVSAVEAQSDSDLEQQSWVLDGEPCDKESHVTESSLMSPLAESTLNSTTDDGVITRAIFALEPKWLSLYIVSPLS
jgi:hypothetical protein